jgi:hypothetical protein|tara:strand:- start:25680 stop:25856 length:177 start_codon:yes stop_codon:yes gene_type:complete
MEVQEIMKAIKPILEEIGNTTAVMYDADKLDKKMFIGMLDETPKGTMKRFMITIEDFI